MLIIKTLIIFLISSLGLILGIYWFITTGSYFLLILASGLGILFGFLLKRGKICQRNEKIILLIPIQK